MRNTWALGSERERGHWPGEGERERWASGRERERERERVCRWNGEEVVDDWGGGGAGHPM
jgi:hypothetical protein